MTIHSVAASNQWPLSVDNWTEIYSFLRRQDLAGLCSVSKGDRLRVKTWRTDQKVMLMRQAKDMAMSIRFFFQKSLIFPKIVQFEATYDLETARATIASIKDVYHRERASIKIAEAEAAHDLERAISTTNDMQHPQCRAEARMAIVEVAITHRNLGAAKKIARLIEDPALKKQAFIKIAEAEVNCNLEGAIFTSTRILDPDDQKDFSLVIVLDLAMRNLEAAKAEARKNSDPYFQARALLAMAKIFA